MLHFNNLSPAILIKCKKREEISGCNVTQMCTKLHESQGSVFSRSATLQHHMFCIYASPPLCSDVSVYRTKLAQQSTSLPPSSLDPCTPTKTGSRTESKVTPDPQTMCPEPAKVTFSSELQMLAELYCACMSGNLPQGGSSELSFQNWCWWNIFCVGFIIMHWPMHSKEIWLC